MIVLELIMKVRFNQKGDMKQTCTIQFMINVIKELRI